MILDKQCLKNRHLSDCNLCLHYKHCKSNTTKEFKFEERLYRVGCAVILDVCNEYEDTYKSGGKRKLKALDKWLRSAETEILSGGKFDGNALADALEKKCEKAYGKFETIYQEVQTTNKAKLKQLLKEQKEATTQEERAELRRKILRVKGILNL